MNIKISKNNSSKLFNYSSKEFKEINTFIEKGTYLTRKDDKIIRVDKQSNIEYRRGEELLFYIRKIKNEIFSFENPLPFKNILLTEDNIKKLNNKIYYVLNSNNPNSANPNEDYYLCKYDIIKMGNIKLIVKDIHIEYNEEAEDKPTNYDIHSLNKDGEPIFNLSPEPKKYIISTEEAKNKNKKAAFAIYINSK